MVEEPTLYIASPPYPPALGKSPAMCCNIYYITPVNYFKVPRLSAGKWSITPYSFFARDLAGEWGSAIIREWLYVRDVVKSWLVCKFDGALDIAVSLDSKQVGVNATPKDLKFIRMTIERQRMGGIDRLSSLLAYGILSAYIVVQQKTYNWLISNRFGLVGGISGQ